MIYYNEMSDGQRPNTASFSTLREADDVVEVRSLSHALWILIALAFAWLPLDNRINHGGH